jgi:hypothetical protein
VLQIITKIVSSHTADSKPVKQEVNGTVILPPLVFPDYNHVTTVNAECHSAECHHAKSRGGRWNESQTDRDVEHNPLHVHLVDEEDERLVPEFRRRFFLAIRRRR